MTRLADSTVLITGAASGIGRRMALLAADAGARVIGWDLDGPALADLARDRPGRIEPFVVDVTDAAAVRRVAGEVVEQVGPVDVLILNAGVVSGGRLLELSEAAIRRVLDVNVAALFWCTKAFLPGMIERGRGHIVTIASIAALAPLPGLTDYNASKHAAYGFAETLRTELAEDAPGVRTTVVLPQVIDTGMFAGVTTPRVFPPLDPDRAAAAILGAVERNRQRLLLNRAALLTAYAIRPLPPRLADAVVRVFGGFDGMRTFAGRSITAAGRGSQRGADRDG
jgi:all-trans-retinol dehydrogenase (NAD+)